LNIKIFKNLKIARLENRGQLEAEIRKADVICIVYAVNVPETFERIPSFWLPYIRSLGRNVINNNYLYKLLNKGN